MTEDQVLLDDDLLTETENASGSDDDTVEDLDLNEDGPDLDDDLETE